ncbi:hypothetical protein INR49_026594 [Caranx melampygus]|nr:hypothetical protein INR49_026594 [Caranx melampygus]
MISSSTLTKPDFTIGHCHFCEHTLILLHDVNDNRSLGVGVGGLPSIVPKENVQCAVKTKQNKTLFKKRKKKKKKRRILGPGVKKFGKDQLKQKREERVFEVILRPRPN